MTGKPRSRWPLRLYAGLLLGVLAMITDAGIVLARAWFLRWAPTTGTAVTIP